MNFAIHVNLSDIAIIIPFFAIKLGLISYEDTIFYHISF